MESKATESKAMESKAMESKATESKATNFLAVLLLAVIVPVVIIPAYFGYMIYSAWATCLLWKWFVTEPFGIRQLTIPGAVGLELLISFLRINYSSMTERLKQNASKTEEEMKRELATSKRWARTFFLITLLAPIMFVALGAVFHSFM